MLRASALLRSQKWHVKQSRDAFVKEANKQGYIARSAFKLIELDDEFSLLSKPHAAEAVIDLGASPGSWCQVIRERISPDALLIGVDLLPLQTKIPGVHFIQGDFATLDVQKAIEAKFTQEAKWTTGAAAGERVSMPESSGVVDVVVSDMCPDRGVGAADRARSAQLNEKALLFAIRNLKPGGHFVCKALGGRDYYDSLLTLGRDWFGLVRPHHVAASRGSSDEHFLVFKAKRSTPKHTDVSSSSANPTPSFMRSTEDGRSSQEEQLSSLGSLTQHRKKLKRISGGGGSGRHRGGGLGRIHETVSRDEYTLDHWPGFDRREEVLDEKRRQEQKRQQRSFRR